MTPEFKDGDRVLIECDGRRVPGTVMLASPNGVSLFLTFEAILAGYVRGMPVLRDDDGSYRTLDGTPLTLRPEILQ